MNRGSRIWKERPMLTFALLFLSLPEAERALATLEFRHKFLFAQIQSIDTEVEKVETEIEELESRIRDPELRRLIPAYRHLERRLRLLEGHLFQLEVEFRRLPFAQ